MELRLWKRTTRRARLVPVAVLAACALIMLAMAALDRFHVYQFEQTLRLLKDFEQSRASVLTGMQRLSVGEETASQADLEAEREALDELLMRLQKVGATLNLSDEGLDNSLAAQITGLQTRLQTWSGGPASARDRAGLQQSFAALNTEMLRLEAAGVQRMDALRQRQQLQYGVGWLLVLTAMLLLGAAVFRNHRELQDAQSALRENDAQYQGLLDMLPQLVWACDAQARTEYLNQRWVEYSGVPMAELMAVGWRQLLHPDDAKPMLKQWAEVVGAGADSLPEFRLRRRDGQYRWFHARFGVNRNEFGQPVRWFGSSVDIDDVRRARAALEHSERLHRETLTALREGVITFDAARRTTSCNPAAERIFGMPRERLLSLPRELWEVRLQYEDGRDMPWDKTPVSTVYATGAASGEVLMQVIKRGGGAMWLLVNAEPLLDAQGRLSAVVASYRDVTERRNVQLELRQQQEGLELAVQERTRALTKQIEARAQAESQLQNLNLQMQETERFTRMVADNIPVRIIYWDRHLRCRFVNHTYCEWFNAKREDIVGRTIFESRGEAYYQSLEPYISAVLRGELQQFERTENNRHGQHTVTRAHYIPDLRDGEVQGFFVLGIDVTREKQSELALLQANAQMGQARDMATAASHAKSAFLANMSHEIRTPMNAIIGFTYMLRRDVQDPVQQERLQKIAGASNHLLQVINDILDLSKIEAGKLVLEAVDFSLDALLSRTCGMVTESASHKGLELVLDIAPLPDRLHGDPTRLMQALLNLLSNAVKFTERGAITLRVELLAETAPQDDTGLLLRFEVMDTGIGIEPLEFAHLFDPFSQADGSSSRLHLGTGLGLAITRHIAEQMGGECGGESTPGEGSRFWFSARLQPAATQEASAAPVLRGMRALVADDLPAARLAVGAMLTGLELRVDMVASGQEALAHYAQAQGEGDPYRIVLLDWAMPGMDGLQTGQRLSASESPPQAQILVSTRDQAAVHQLARDAGFGAVLMKPLTASKVLDSLMRLLKNAGWPQPAPDLSVPLDYPLQSHHQSARVLLAEDNPVNQEVALQLLKAAGLNADVASDGQQAVEMVRKGGYDLVLMDVQMPRMDGLQATRLLRQDPAFARLPIIAVTANALQTDVDACMAAGMNEHLAKPVDPRLLHQALLRWLPQLPVPPITLPVAAAKERSPEQKLAQMATLIDLDAAYEYCAGQASILMGVMRKFVDHYRDAGHNLEQHLGAADMQAAGRLLHSLRGVSATIGATDLLKQTRALEDAIKAGQDGDALMAQAQALRVRLDALVAGVGQGLDS